jgi:predicted amidohydrolase
MLQIALLQMVSCGLDRAASLTKGEQYCRRAKAFGADLALFPEMWNIGYTSFCPDAMPETDLWKAPENWSMPVPPEDPARADAREEWQARAIPTGGPYVRHFQALARELEMAIAITYLEQWPGAPRNTVSLIDRHGEIVLTYAKVHTCDFDPMEDALTAGDDFPVATLDTADGPVQIGAMICYDREFPESARILMLNGAEIILTPNSCPLEANRLAQFRTRAIENMVGVAMTNYAAPQANGHSVAYDPYAFDEQGNSRNPLIVEGGEDETILLAPFDLAKLRAYRLREAWGNAFRRPHRYTALTDPTPAPPFLRVNAAGERYDPTRR